MEVPEDRRYSEEHEWAFREDDGSIRVGITDYAQDALGDVVYVELPETGRQVQKGETFAEVESTKSVAEVYAPVAGTVVEVNEQLADSPEFVNRSPYGEGWFALIDPTDPDQFDDLLTAEAYEELTG